MFEIDNLIITCESLTIPSYAMEAKFPGNLGESLKALKDWFIKFMKDFWDKIKEIFKKREKKEKTELQNTNNEAEKAYQRGEKLIRESKVEVALNSISINISKTMLIYRKHQMSGNVIDYDEIDDIHKDIQSDFDKIDEIMKNNVGMTRVDFDPKDIKKRLDLAKQFEVGMIGILDRAIVVKNDEKSIKVATVKRTISSVTEYINLLLKIIEL